MNDYRTITLVTRENLNCANMTADEFIMAMFSDMLEAEEKYNEMYVPEYVNSIINYFEYCMRSARNRATKFAEKKWKTEKKRNEYIKKELEKTRDSYNHDKYYDSLSFFDFDVNPGEMGISGDCCLSFKGLTMNALKRCFEKVKDNKYFKKATGWKLTYECSNNSVSTCFRPHIELIVDAETKAQMEKDERDLTESVRKFYEGCTYWGDYFSHNIN